MKKRDKKEVLDILTYLWMYKIHHPELRVCQIISNAVSMAQKANCYDVFYVGDETLLKGLKLLMAEWNEFNSVHRNNIEEKSNDYNSLHTFKNITAYTSDGRKMECATVPLMPFMDYILIDSVEGVEEFIKALEEVDHRTINNKVDMGIYRLITDEGTGDYGFELILPLNANINMTKDIISHIRKGENNE